ncbi:MAG: hypothetical protein JWL73_1109 [Actinomycetia bacterium]|nr:hypothetical protein [Actinomycetes bacterium]
MSEYDELLIEAYGGEVFGDTFFGTLADVMSDVAQREKVRMLQRIEALTASHLRPLVDEAGLEVDPAPMAAQGLELAGGMADQSWTGLLEGLRGALPDFLTKFLRLQEIGGHDDVLADLVAHEQAIDRFAELELEGRSEEAVGVLHAHLERSGSALAG